jgi:hypothetical protein
MLDDLQEIFEKLKCLSNDDELSHFQKELFADAKDALRGLIAIERG